jgi:hypothetical protein
MRSVRRTLLTATALCLMASIFMPTAVTGAPGGPLDLSLCAPDQNRFTLNIDNRYFPLRVGQRWVFQGKEQGETIGLQISVLDQTEDFVFDGRTITTRVVEEVEWADANANGVIDSGENLIERSLNYFAQTTDGTVCYFGEVVDIYEDGEIVSHEGSWRADDPGNAPGIYMPAKPREGMTFQQEVAPGVAEDLATIVDDGDTVRVPAGRFRDTIRVRDFNPLDGSRGIKIYAPDVGLIRDGPLRLIDF